MIGAALFVLALGIGIGYVFGWRDATEQALGKLRELEEQIAQFAQFGPQEPPRPRLVKR